jgi:hypothetical protein
MHSTSDDDAKLGILAKHDTLYLWKEQDVHSYFSGWSQAGSLSGTRATVPVSLRFLLPLDSSRHRQ